MKRSKIKEMVLAILGTADYDLAKSFDPECAEEPEAAEEELNKLVDLALTYLEK